MFRRIPRVRQHDVADCGAACLRSVGLHFGLNLPISRLRQFASTDRSGTSVMGLVEAATSLGFSAKGVRATAESFGRVPLPAIAHLKLGNGLLHFVVVYATDSRGVLVMDPSDGRVARHDLTTFVEVWTGVLVLLVPTERLEIRGVGRSLAGRFLELIRPHRSVLLQALVGSVAYTLLGLSTAVYVRLIVDYVIVDGNRNLLNLLSLSMLVLLALQIYLGSVKRMLALRTSQKIDAALVLGYYRHLLRLPQRFFDTMRVGEVISRMTDAVKIRAFINDASLDLAVNALVVIFSFTLMFLYSWKVALVVAMAVPLYALVLAVTNAVNRRVLRNTMERAADLESQLVESISGMATIKRFGLEAEAASKIEQRLIRLLRPAFRAGVTSAHSGHAAELISKLSVIALFWVGSGFVIRNEMTPGELMSFYALLGYLTGPVMHLIGANRTVQDALIAADRLFEIMDLDGEEDGRHARSTVIPPGDIHFERVCFRYGSRGRVLSDLDLMIHRGQLTAIVGQSGSGKTTAMSLLQKLYPIESGFIRVGGVDLRNLDTTRLRGCIASVPQEVHLFSGTVIENIAIGASAPNMAKVFSICHEIGLHQFIESLPEGYATMLGGSGVALSGGQRQKIAIARALYRDPDILILDEASSNLDSIGEESVLRCLLRLRTEGRTVIVIAHRLATVVRADRIVVMENGKVCEEGTHSALLRANGTYSNLWAHQHPPIDSCRPQERGSPPAVLTGSAG
jgi:ATP-binding cassette, subfamily C, bacteriocin exporter